jgi:S-adenosylmethionine-dependent methyltransferase
MIDDVSDIKILYDSDPEKEHTRLESHQLEHDITWRYFDKYLPASGAILEIGAATGKYTLELVKRGSVVTAVDLSESLLEICQRRIAEIDLEGQVKYMLADARDLSALNGEIFNAVLLMGPLYHLVFEEDRLLALQEVYQRLKPGGVLFSSFISRFGIFGELLKNIPEWIEDQTVVRSLIKQGRRPDDYPRGGFRGYFATVSEMAPLHAKSWL